MNLINIFNEGYSSILKTLGANKPAAPTAPAAPAAPPAPPVKAPTIDTKDSAKSGDHIKGTAKTAPIDICSLDNTIDQWIEKRVLTPEGKVNPKAHKVEIPAGTTKLGALNHLCGAYADKKGYSHDQRVQLQSFLKEIQAKSDKLDNPLMRNNILSILGDAICERGISEEQMSMIADGQFNADAYIAMVNKTGEPIA